MNQINFFFLIKLCQGAWISFLAFRCDNTTYNPSSCVFYFVRGLGYIFLSLGVTTLHITPVTLPCIRCYCNGGGSRPLLGMPTTVNKHLHIGY